MFKPSRGAHQRPAMIKSSIVLLAVSASSALAQSSGPATPPASPGLVRITGTVTDSLRAGPLVGAEVVVDGTSSEGRTDSLGRYTIDSVPAGRHQIAVYHPLLDSAQVSLATEPIDFVAGGTPDLALAVPSGRTLLARLCARDAVAEIVAIGMVRDADSDQPIPGAMVSATVVRVAVGRGDNNKIGLQRTTGTLRVATDASGSFHLCIPGAQQLSFSARLGGARTDNIGYEAPNGVTFPVLRVARADSALPAGDTTVAPIEGHASLIGHVTDAAGKPIKGATIEVLGTYHVATSDRDGAYRLDSLPSGTRVLVVRHLGYPERVTAVDLPSRTPKQLTNVLEVAVATLPKVDVTGRKAAIAAALDRVGFTRRQQGKVGHFLSPDQITAIDGRTAIDLLMRMPGTRVSNTTNGRHIIPAGSISSDGRGCTLYIVDNRQVHNMGLSDDQLLPRAIDIIGIELYGPGETPIGGSTPPAGCLVFRIWTTAVAPGS